MPKCKYCHLETLDAVTDEKSKRVLFYQCLGCGHTMLTFTKGVSDKELEGLLDEETP